MSDTAATAPAASAPAAAPADSAPPAAAAPAFAVGNLVSHSWEDTYDGECTRYGLVVAVHPDEGEGKPARVSVAWLEGPAVMSPELLAGVGA